jgi:CHRD domain
MHKISLITVAGLLMLMSPVIAEGVNTFAVSATGSQEVPGPGDSDGSASANLTLNPEKEEVCFEIQVKDIASATLAHIHAGAAGTAGPVVISLTAPTEGFSKGCAHASRELIQQISQNPGNFYLNIHNAEFKTGAVRGQLGKNQPAQESAAYSY